jgi:hypothetical protein
MPLKVGEGLLGETFTTFRSCGQGRSECVVYWAGPVEQPGEVDRLIHPDHDAGPQHYEVCQDWLNRIWFDLNAEQAEIRAQIHTHGAAAFHSPRDDAFPFLQTEGFRSLVIPYFACDAVGLEGAYLAELHPGGVWHELDPISDLEVA